MIRLEADTPDKRQRRRIRNVEIDPEWLRRRLGGDRDCLSPGGASGPGMLRAREGEKGKGSRVDQWMNNRGQLLPLITSVRDQAKGLANSSTRATTRP